MLPSHTLQPALLKAFRQPSQGLEHLQHWTWPCQQPVDINSECEYFHLREKLPMIQQDLTTNVKRKKGKTKRKENTTNSSVLGCRITHVPNVCQESSSRGSYDESALFLRPKMGKNILKRPNVALHVHSPDQIPLCRIMSVSSVSYHPFQVNSGVAEENIDSPFQRNDFLNQTLHVRLDSDIASNSCSSNFLCNLLSQAFLQCERRQTSK